MRQIKALQVFRGLACLAVVIYHAAISTSAFVGPVPSTAAAIFGQGYLGVDFFFVLSGFIIMYAHSSDGHSVDSTRRYIYKRLVRIFPVYLPVALAMIALYSIVPSISATGGRDYSLVSSLFLVPANRPPILTVTWSLVHEMIFYGVFLVFFVSRRLFAVVLIFWAGAILAVNRFGEPANWLHYPLSLLNIEFMFGVVAAYVVNRNYWRGSPQWLVLCGLLLTVSILESVDLSVVGMMRILFAAGLAIIIWGFALWERASAISWPTWLIVLGNASYSIYLIHNQIFSVTQRLSIIMSLNWLGCMIFSVLAALLAGYSYHLAVEQPALRFFGNRKVAKTARVRAELA
jgi:exopolysaccharide production protein ExoZ